MGDVEGKSVKLSAVGKDGADITVEKDFSIHVEYENYYLCYEEALENEPVFIIKQPSLDIEEYDEDGIEEVYFPNMGLYSAGNGLFQFIKIGEPSLKEGTTEIDIKMDEFLGYLFEKSGDLATQLWASAASQYDNMKDLLDYDKKSVVIRDEPSLKAGYFTTNRFGATNYNLVIVTCNQVYYAKNCRFHNGWDEDETADNEAFLDRLLKSVKIVNSGKIEKPQTKVSKFVLPTYEDGVRVFFDDFSISIPDGLEYVTEDHLPDGDELANVLTSEYLIVAADKDCAGGLRKFKDASLGINIADQGSSNINPIFWEHIDEALDGKVNMTIGDSNVKFVKGGDGYIIGYGKGNECQSKDEPYWAVYYVVIMLKNKQYMCNLYFNSKKTTAKNYNQTLEDFCNGIEVGGGKTKTPKSSSTSKSKNTGGDINNTEEKKKTDKKKAEEKKNVEEQKKIEERKKEEGKKKLEKELDSEAAKMVIEWRREYKELERVWRRRLDDHQRRISSKVYMSSYEVSTDMRKIISDRDSYGKQYDSLIKEVDTSGKELVKNGCSSKGVKSIKDIIDEIIEESGALDIDFGTNGMMTMDLGRTKFSVSAASKRIQSWWNDKYGKMPDVIEQKRKSAERYEKSQKKKKITDELKQSEKRLSEAKEERAELDSKEKNHNKWNKEDEKTLSKLVEGYDESREKIENNYDGRIKTNDEKLDELKRKRSDIQSNVSSINVQISKLPFWKGGQKKELRMQIADLEGEISKIGDEIKKTESKRNELNVKRNNEINLLSKKIEEKKEKIAQRQKELEEIPKKKTALDSEIENLQNKIEDLNEQLNNI